MALLDTTHRLSDRNTRPKRDLHPSICLVSGFGFIIAAALAVHVIFNAIL